MQIKCEFQCERFCLRDRVSRGRTWGRAKCAINVNGEQDSSPDSSTGPKRTDTSWPFASVVAECQVACTRARMPWKPHSSNARSGTRTCLVGRLCSTSPGSPSCGKDRRFAISADCIICNREGKQLIRARVKNKSYSAASTEILEKNSSMEVRWYRLTRNCQKYFDDYTCILHQLQKCQNSYSIYTRIII